MLDPRTRLREAIIEGNLSITSRLLRRFPQYLKNVDPTNGWSLLHYAGFYGHYIICVHLINLGHDKDEISLNFAGNAPIHTTVQSGNHQTLLMMLQSFPSAIDTKGERLRAPIHLAAILNFANCVDTLIEKGANVNVVDLDGNTPLHLAMQYGAKECVQTLVRHHAQIDVRNAAGWLPSEVARDASTLEFFNALKSDVLAGKYTRSPSQTVLGLATSTTSADSQLVFQQPSGLPRSTSEVFMSIPPPPIQRKHSNSLPGGVLAPSSTPESPHTPKDSSSELSLILLPVFPPSIAPALPSRPDQLPLRPVPFQSKRMLRISNTRQFRSNSNEGRGRLHSNLVGSIVGVRPVKSSSSLGDSRQVASRSRAGSVQNMINTPARGRSNTMMSYGSAMSENLSKQGTSHSTPASHQVMHFDPGKHRKVEFALSEESIADQHISGVSEERMDEITSSHEEDPDSSVGTHIFNHSDNGSDDSGTDVDSSDDELDEDEMSPLMLLRLQQTEEEKNEVPKFNIRQSTPRSSDLKGKPGHLDNPQHLNLNISDASRFVNDRLRLSSGGMTSTPSHQELAKFYSPNLGNSSGTFANIDDVSRPYLITPKDSTFGVNPFLTDPKDTLETVRSRNGSTGSLVEPKLATLDSGWHSPDVGSNKRSSILAVPIVLRRDRAINGRTIVDRSMEDSSDVE